MQGERHGSTVAYPAEGAISLKKVSRQAAWELERKIILRTLQNNHWNRKRAARALDISYRTLLYKAKEAGVPPKNAHHGKALLESLTTGAPLRVPLRNTRRIEG